MSPISDLESLRRKPCVPAIRGHFIATRFEIAFGASALRGSESEFELLQAVHTLMRVVRCSLVDHRAAGCDVDSEMSLKSKQQRQQQQSAVLSMSCGRSL